MGVDMPKIKVDNEVISITQEQMDLLRKSFNGNKKSVEIDGRIIDPKQISDWKVKPEHLDLPTDNIILDENRNITSLPEYKLRGTKYILCKVHYKTENNGEKGYLLEESKIPEMLFMIPDYDNPGYPNIVTKILRYGEEQTKPELRGRW